MRTTRPHQRTSRAGMRVVTQRAPGDEGNTAFVIVAVVAIVVSLIVASLLILGVGLSPFLALLT